MACCARWAMPIVKHVLIDQKNMKILCRSFAGTLWLVVRSEAVRDEPGSK